MRRTRRFDWLSNGWLPAKAPAWLLLELSTYVDIYVDVLSDTKFIINGIFKRPPIPPLIWYLMYETAFY